MLQQNNVLSSLFSNMKKNQIQAAEPSSEASKKSKLPAGETAVKGVNPSSLDIGGLQQASKLDKKLGTDSSEE